MALLLMKRAFADVVAPGWRLLVLAGLLCRGTTLAQLTNDEVPHSRTVPAADEIKAEIERSRIHLGPIRLLPTLQVTNAGYDSNVFGTPENQGPVSDVTMTVVAGGKAILPVGPKMYLQADILPEYNWFDKLADRRAFGGLFKGSVFGFFNRMSLEVDGYDQKTLSFYSAESPEKVIERVTDGTGGIEVTLLGPLSVFGRVEGQRLRFEPGGGQPAGSAPDVASLARDETAARAGVRLQIRSYWNVSAAVEGARTEFVETPEQRNNQSVAYLLGFHFDRPRFFLNVSGGYRKGTPFQGSQFPEYGTATGSYFASFFATERLEIRAFGRRYVGYGLSVASPYFIGTQNGGGVNLQVLRRLLLRGFGDYGTNDYAFPTVGTEQPRRLDHVTDYGGGLSLLVSRKLVINALATRSTYSSNIPGLGRSILQFTTGLSFDGEFSR